MIKINGFEHVSGAASELEPGQRTLALFGIKPTGFEEIHDQDVTSNYFEGDGDVRFEIIRPLGPKSHCGSSGRPEAPACTMSASR
ncbi:MAG: hypothetical protein ABWZ64_04870 [Xanthobacteraceae bacterium]